MVIPDSISHPCATMSVSLLCIVLTQSIVTVIVLTAVF